MGVSDKDLRDYSHTPCAIDIKNVVGNGKWCWKLMDRDGRNTAGHFGTWQLCFSISMIRVEWLEMNLKFKTLNKYRSYTKNVHYSDFLKTLSHMNYPEGFTKTKILVSKFQSTIVYFFSKLFVKIAFCIELCGFFVGKIRTRTSHEFQSGVLIEGGESFKKEIN